MWLGRCCWVCAGGGYWGQRAIILKVLGKKIDDHTNVLQFGFSHGKSPSMATLCLSEAIVEAKDKKEHLYVAILDASKAFDVVDHNILQMKLHEAQVGVNIWCPIDSLYNDCHEVVRWEGEYSR